MRVPQQIRFTLIAIGVFFWSCLVRSLAEYKMYVYTQCPIISDDGVNKSTLFINHRGETRQERRKKPRRNEVHNIYKPAKKHAR